jgi:signal transduction histidine kinase
VLRTEPDPDGNGIRFSVQDHGPGIAFEALPHVFDRFWQSGSTAHKGAGLGLAIAKGIAEAHEGRVWAESVTGKGSTFYLGLPFSPQCS